MMHFTKWQDHVESIVYLEVRNHPTWEGGSVETGRSAQSWMWKSVIVKDVTLWRSLSRTKCQPDPRKTQRERQAASTSGRKFDVSEQDAPKNRWSHSIFWIWWRDPDTFSITGCLVTCAQAVGCLERSALLPSRESNQCHWWIHPRRLHQNTVERQEACRWGPAQCELSRCPVLEHETLADVRFFFCQFLKSSLRWFKTDGIFQNVDVPVHHVLKQNFDVVRLSAQSSATCLNIDET